MNRVSILACLIASLACSTVSAETATDKGISSNTVDRVENFRLLDHQDRSVELYRAADTSAVVLFTHGVGCPIVRKSVPELNRLATKYEKSGVAFYMINANTQDSRADLAEEAEAYDISIPILRDPTQRIVHAMGSSRTAEALVLDPKDDWKIIYRGPLDDRFDYGAQKEEADQRWVENVLDAHLAGKDLVLPAAKTKGCLISFDEEKDVSYANDVVPILQANCISCHQKGGMGPFAMSDYKKVKGWSDMIRETLRTQRMPPWHADPAYKSFHNSLGLTDTERRTLLTWVEQGSQLGEGGDPLAESDFGVSTEWTLGKPQHIVQIPEEQQLPAEGVFDYRYITVPSNLTENRWLTGVEVLPTSKEVVHHALIFIMYPPEYQHLERDPKGGLDGFFASYLPSGNLQPFPKGTAQFVPAGSTFIFQMHYNATGKDEVDQTRMGLYFQEEPPEEVLYIRAAAETDFEIPAGAKDYATTASFKFRDDATLLGLSPHMHYRGSRFRFEAQYPDDRKDTLLSVPWYEFDWQPMYFFDKPIPIAEGTRIVCEGAFDNSDMNPRNPDPTQKVHFGEQTYEEMFIGYICYSQPYSAEGFKPAEMNPDNWAGFGKPLTEAYLTGTTWGVGDRFRLRFDPDGQLDINDRFKGTWKLEGDVVRVSTPRRDFELLVQGDSLQIDGRPLRRIPAKQETKPAT